ncbi:hypothetical protein EZS27_028637, partial [termite gut metagenome]
VYDGEPFPAQGTITPYYLTLSYIYQCTLLDGTVYEPTDMSPTDAGNYTITLTVSDAAGSDVTTQPVTISVALRSITFDATGGLPAPSTQLTRNGGKIAEPETPVKTDFMFAGWYSETGERIDFKTFTVNSDMTIHAKWWKGPEQFIFINGIDLEFFYDKINAMFGDQTGKRVAVGQAFILYCFERRREVMLKNVIYCTILSFVIAPFVTKKNTSKDN